MFSVKWMCVRVLNSGKNYLIGTNWLNAWFLGVQPADKHSDRCSCLGVTRWNPTYWLSSPSVSQPVVPKSKIGISHKPYRTERSECPESASKITLVTIHELTWTGRSTQSHRRELSCEIKQKPLQVVAEQSVGWVGRIIYNLSPSLLRSNLPLTSSSSRLLARPSVGTPSSFHIHLFFMSHRVVFECGSCLIGVLLESEFWFRTFGPILPTGGPSTTHSDRPMNVRVGTVSIGGEMFGKSSGNRSWNGSIWPHRAEWMFKIHEYIG